MLSRDQIRTARAIVGIVILAAAPLAPSLLGGRVLLPADLLMVMQPFKAHAAELGFRRVSNPILDAVQQFWPWRKFAGQQLRLGIIAWWNPYMLSGTPFVANDQSALFYPETWLFALLAPERAFAVAAFLYLAASGIFMFWFLRLLGLRRRSAFIGAAAWMFNGFVVGWICLPAFRSVPGWLPLMLVGLELSLRRPRPHLGISIAAGACAIHLLAGNLHISFYVLLAFGLWALWRAATGAGWRAAAWAGAAVALGAVASAIQVLPVLEATARSHRPVVDLATLCQYRLPLAYLLACLMPDLFGNPVDYNHWGAFIGPIYRAYTETAWYVGAASVPLAALALVGRRRWAAGFGIIGAVGLLLALSPAANLALGAVLPPFRRLLGINRAIVMTSFALAALAALGADALVAGQLRRQARTTLIGAVAVAFVGCLWAWVRSGQFEAQGIGPLSAYTWLQFARFAALASLPVLLLAARSRPACFGACLVLAADVAYFAWHFFPQPPVRFASPPSELVERLAAKTERGLAEGQPFRIVSIGPNALDRLPPNVPMLFGLLDVQGSDSISYGRYRRALDAASDERFGFRQPSPDAGLLPSLAVRYIVTPLELPGLPLVTAWECNLYELHGPLPFALLCKPIGRAGSEASLRALARDGCVGLMLDETAARKPSSTRAAEILPAKAFIEDPNRIIVRIPPPPWPGHLLRVACVAYPGWRAWVDGKPVPVWVVDYCLLGVQLPANARQATLIFWPASGAIGGFLTLLGAALLAAIFVLAAQGGRGRG